MVDRGSLNRLDLTQRSEILATKGFTDVPKNAHVEIIQIMGGVFVNIMQSFLKIEGSDVSVYYHDVSKKLFIIGNTGSDVMACKYRTSGLTHLVVKNKSDTDEDAPRIRISPQVFLCEDQFKILTEGMCIIDSSDTPLFNVVMYRNGRVLFNTKSHPGAKRSASSCDEECTKKGVESKRRKVPDCSNPWDYMSQKIAVRNNRTIESMLVSKSKIAVIKLPISSITCD